MRHFFIVPSLECPASCKYCFGPHEKSDVMHMNTLRAFIDWQNTLKREKQLSITFHGGEPLCAGIDFYRTAFPLLKSNLLSTQVSFGMQSNLWLLTDEYCDLFSEFKLSLSTSIDGPEHINDNQRGTGYFKRTMAGLELARKRGFKVNCVCTFTQHSVPYYKEVFDFFAREELDFTIHTAISSIRHPNFSKWALSPEAYGDLLERMLDLYTYYNPNNRIGVLDGMIKSVSSQSGVICTFCDCLGMFSALGPNGAIYPCQRFVGIEKFVVGNVYTCPSLDELSLSPAWKLFDDRQKLVTKECGKCSYLEFCRGGCPYTAFTISGENFENTLKDIHCSAYQRIFNSIIDKAMKEVFSKSNMDEVLSAPSHEDGLLRKGKLISIMREQ